MFYNTASESKRCVQAYIRNSFKSDYTHQTRVHLTSADNGVDTYPLTVPFGPGNCETVPLSAPKSCYKLRIPHKTRPRNLIPSYLYCREWADAGETRSLIIRRQIFLELDGNRVILFSRRLRKFPSNSLSPSCFDSDLIMVLDHFDTSNASRSGASPFHYRGRKGGDSGCSIAPTWNFGIKPYKLERCGVRKICRWVKQIRSYSFGKIAVKMHIYPSSLTNYRWFEDGRLDVC